MYKCHIGSCTPRRTLMEAKKKKKKKKLLDDHFSDALTARTCNGHHCQAPARTRHWACPRQTLRPYSQPGTLGTSTSSHASSSINTHARQLYLANRPKRIDLHVTHVRCVLTLANAGAFFAELTDVLVAPAFAHRLALYMGHNG